MKAVAHTVRGQQTLTDWRVQPGIDIATKPAEQDWKAVQLPYAVSHVDYNNLWFETEVEVPDIEARFYLKVSGLQCDAVLFIDGQKICETRGPEARVDITAAVTPGRRSHLLLWVTRWWEGTANQRKDDFFRNATINDQRKVFRDGEDGLRRSVLLGISRGIWLETRPRAAEIDNVFVMTSVRRSELTAVIDIINHKHIDCAELEVKVTELSGDDAGLPHGLFKVENPSAEPRIQQAITIPWKDPHLWEIGAPYLYHLRVRLLDGSGNVIDEYPVVSFGFREVWTEGRELILNGHPVHFKLAPAIHTVASMIFYEGIGFNAMLIQPNPSFWFGAKRSGLFPDERSVSQAATKEILDEADRRGWAVYMAAPTVNFIGLDMLKPEVQQQYRDYFRMWMRDLDRQNRPSILSWTPSMNTVGEDDPDTIGRIIPKKSCSILDQVKMEAYKIIKSMDSTRLVYHHHGGGTDCGGLAGDIETCNFYPNFMPLQELEDYLEPWSKNGDRPYGSCEYGALWETDFFNHGRLVPQFTEYSARYLGDMAYDAESDEYIDASLKVVRNPIGDWRRGYQHAGVYGFQLLGCIHKVVEWTAFGDLVRLFVRNNYRSWRALGLGYGCYPWVNYSFGVPPTWKKPDRPDMLLFNYSELRDVEDYEQLKQRPEWANCVYDAYKEAMSPLMVYIGGPMEKITAKDHNYFSGESVEKTIVAIWDGVGDKHLRVEWQLIVDGESRHSGVETLVLKTGDIEKRPIRFEVPAVSSRQNAKIIITACDARTDESLAHDEFQLAFFPKRPTVEEVRSKIGIFDPSGKTIRELTKIVFRAEIVTIGDSVVDFDVLIIGRDAVRIAGKLPFTEEDVRRGLRVVFFEQTLEGLEALGMRAQDIVPRYMFPRIKGHPILRGLDPEDLVNWRGSGTLISERSYENRKWLSLRPQHVGNYGLVASVVIETPMKGAFTPVVECEFDLSYSPLLIWTHGKGEIVFSQFDLTDRLDVEPAAAILAVNIIKYIDTPASIDQEKRLVYFGAGEMADEDVDFLKRLGLELRVEHDFPDLQQSDIVVIGTNSLDKIGARIRRLKDHVSAGGTVFVLPQSEDAIDSAGLDWDVRVEGREMTKVILSETDRTHQILRGIGPQLVHWRTYLSLNPFTQVPDRAEMLLSGLMLLISEGANAGQWVFCQVDWRGLNDQSTEHVVEHLIRPRWNTIRLYRQLFTNLKVQSSQAVTSNLMTPVRYTPMVDIDVWLVYERVHRVSEPARERRFPALAETLDVESWVHESRNRRRVDDRYEFVKIASEKGIVNFDRLPHKRHEQNIAYALTYVYSSRAREAVFSVVCDYWIQLKVNGVAYLDHSKTQRSGNPLRMIWVRAPLNPGWNLLEVKVGSGGGGFSFGVQVDDPGDVRVHPSIVEPDQAPRDLPSETELITVGAEVDREDIQYGGKYYEERLDNTSLFDDYYYHGGDPYAYNPW